MIILVSKKEVLVDEGFTISEFGGGCLVVYNNGYIMHRIYIKSIKKYRQVGLHRLILGAKKGEVVDHINGNKLDNRTSNLRICTSSVNGRNRHTPPLSNTGFFGVHYIENRGSPKKYRAMFTLNNKNTLIGYYETAEEAAFYYNETIIKKFGQGFRVNVIQ